MAHQPPPVYRASDSQNDTATTNKNYNNSLVIENLSINITNGELELSSPRASNTTEKPGQSFNTVERDLKRIPTIFEEEVQESMSSDRNKTMSSELDNTDSKTEELNGLVKQDDHETNKHNQQESNSENIKRNSECCESSLEETHPVNSECGFLTYAGTDESSKNESLPDNIMCVGESSEIVIDIPTDAVCNGKNDIESINSSIRNDDFEKVEVRTTTMKSDTFSLSIRNDDTNSSIRNDLVVDQAIEGELD